ncbi:uncharacterized protein LOC127750510 [Frankliniella occidentalis]|uniref:Uncharacterized protein LOC127750510 n=1 Tax=Frankliniella occidentalis TaxID=133901 RepID=A0A9C6XRG5_FRAOC|nr:uncharacterized protein LOC127750510 [Frankliniella occidentalis]
MRSEADGVPHRNAKPAFDAAVWAVYSGGLQLYALTLSGITGQLARDLRQDCLRALRAAGAWVPDHNEHVAAMRNDKARLAWSARRRSTAPAASKGVRGMDNPADSLDGSLGDTLRDTLVCPELRDPHGDILGCPELRDPWRASSPRDEFCWRRLRVRHMVLVDMGCMASAITSWQVLVMIIFSVTYSATCVSTTAGTLSDQQNGPVDPPAKPTSFLLLFVCGHPALYAR